MINAEEAKRLATEVRKNIIDGELDFADVKHISEEN